MNMVGLPGAPGTSAEAAARRSGLLGGLSGEAVSQDLPGAAARSDPNDTDGGHVGVKSSEHAGSKPGTAGEGQPRLTGPQVVVAVEHGPS